MATFNASITKTVASLVKNISTRNRDVLSRRFGLKTGKKETLESIGKSYKITRERVRQIEEFSLAQLAKAIQGNDEIKKYSALANDVLNQNGGVMKEGELFRVLTGSDKESVANASLVFILTLAGQPVRFYENESYHSFWALTRDEAGSFKNLVSGLVGAFEKAKSPVVADQFGGFVRENNSAGQSVSDKRVEAVLAVSKQLGKNVFGEIGLIDWSEVRPKGVRDKAYLVLKKEKSPKHFTEISKLINTTGFSSKKANIQTVHNELIKDSRFVLVGRGMYGLSEWGYRPGTVKDVLVDVLKNHGKPLTKTELVAKVLDTRLVKENTILLNLQDSKVFSKKDDGTYALRKA